MKDDNYLALRHNMVISQIAARGLTQPELLRVMDTVPRHLFVPEPSRQLSYGDHPLPIGAGQTISQPYIVAFMTDLILGGAPGKVLEIGTGSGYQAAVLSALANEVYSIEIIGELAGASARLLEELGCANVRVRRGDGYYGWPEAAPFDAVIVSCAPETVPAPLQDQLAEGGKLVIPVGGADSIQFIEIIEKKAGRLLKKNSIPVRFVPMTGAAGSVRP